MKPDITAIIKSLPALNTSLKVLDVGCGNKPYQKYFTRAEYIGIDVEISGHDDSLKLADKYFDGITIPFPNESFDLIICTEVLEHALDPVRLTNEIIRVLKPGGDLILSAPSMWGEHEIPFDFRRYTSFGITQLLEPYPLTINKFIKESEGIPSYLELGKSEIYNSTKNPQIAHIKALIFGAFLKMLTLFLNIKMPRIYLSNILHCTKN